MRMVGVVFALPLVRVGDREDLRQVGRGHIDLYRLARKQLRIVHSQASDLKACVLQRNQHGLGTLREHHSLWVNPVDGAPQGVSVGEGCA